MIIKALYDFYHSHADLPQFGTEMKEIAYIIVIDRNGEFRRIESRKKDNRTSTAFQVAKAVKRSCNSVSNILWDNGKYALGLRPEDAAYHALFREIVNEIKSLFPDDLSIDALAKYLQTDGSERDKVLQQDTLYGEAIQNSYSSNFSYRIEGDDCIIAEKHYLFSRLVSENNNNTVKGRCLVTGRISDLARLTSSTPIAGSKANASLISFQRHSGYDSYGKEQTYNAPISQEAEFAFSSALKYLLRKESRNKYSFGDRTYIFWSDSKDEITKNVESNFFEFLASDTKPKESAAISDKVHQVFKSIWSGQIKTKLDDRFFFLGLAPNAARIAVVSWNDFTIQELAAHILEHFNDMEMYSNSKYPVRYGIYSMLAAIIPEGGTVAKNCPSSLIDNLFAAIISGTPYPLPLFMKTLERIRTENNVSLQRTAMIKAYINRNTKHHNNYKPLSVMLDRLYENPGYLCGRLVAVLEKIQESSDCGDSIRTRFMGAASSTPAAVFATMIRLSSHHIAKLNQHSRIFYEKIIQEILDKIAAKGVPAHLDPIDQGRFFVGYYHQRSDFFTPKNKNE